MLVFKMKKSILFFFLVLIVSCTTKTENIPVELRHYRQSTVVSSPVLCDEQSVMSVYNLNKDHNIINRRGFHKVGRPYKIDDVEFWPKTHPKYVETGKASWYGTKFYNKNTANGEIFKKGDLTAAHRILPLPSLVRVTNLDSGKSIILKVNDRGPFVKSKERIIDVSEEAATRLGFKDQGIANVKVELLAYETVELNKCIAKDNPKHHTNSPHSREYHKDNKYSMGQSSVKTEFYNKNAS